MRYLVLPFLILFSSCDIIVQNKINDKGSAIETKREDNKKIPYEVNHAEFHQERGLA